MTAQEFLFTVAVLGTIEPIWVFTIRPHILNYLLHFEDCNLRYFERVRAKEINTIVCNTI